MNRRVSYGMVAAAFAAVILAGCSSQPSVTGKCTSKYIEYDGAEAEYTVVLTDTSGTEHHVITEDDDFRSANCHPETGSTIKAKDLDVPGTDD